MACTEKEASKAVASISSARIAGVTGSATGSFSPQEARRRSPIAMTCHLFIVAYSEKRQTYVLLDYCNIDLVVLLAYIEIHSAVEREFL